MAIATDATSSAQASATSVTATHVNTGSDLLTTAGIWVQRTTDDLTDVTYNAVSMSQMGHLDGGSSFEQVHLYGLLNPATGSNSLTLTKTNADLGYVIGSSYTGVSQSGLPDASDTSSVASGTSLTSTVTSIADNCWTVMMSKATANQTAGTGTTLRQVGPNNAQTGVFDSNAAITPAGSTSLQTTFATANAGQVMISFAPAVAAAEGNALAFSNF